MVQLGSKKIDLINRIKQLKQKKAELVDIGIQLKEAKVKSGVLDNIRTGSLATKDDISFVQVPNLDKKCSDLMVSINRKGWIIKSVII